MISAEKALQIILDNTRLLEPAGTPIIDSIDMVLAEDIIAGEDYPPFDKSTIDGFAVRSIDIGRSERANPVILSLDGDIKTGESYDQQLAPNHAVKVASGATLPKGADTVVSADHAVRESAKKVRIYKPFKPGENIQVKGDEIESGSVVFSRGRTISATDIGVLAAIGMSKVECYRRPRISFFASGNDLISYDDPMCDGKVRVGATYTLQAQLIKYGAEPINLGIMEMNPEEIKLRMEKGMESDMMIVTSGSSGGDFDYLKTILQKYGLDLKFWRVAIRPGKPFIFGMIDSVPVFGFSDNIISSIVLMEQFVRPSISKMRGKCDDRRTEVSARLTKDIRGGNGMTHFVRAEVHLIDNEFIAIPMSSRGMPAVNAFVSANGFIILPPEVPGYSSGDTVKVQIINESISLN